ncbi:hypothetical protein [Streptosporangium sp. NPDC006930]|uniref:hypothetical protein n=1 Tax=Streptosporangium sp. NPDC006930 TaxID=3154783 RepID=UPI00342728BC
MIIKRKKSVFAAGETEAQGTPTTDATAERHDKALAVVQRLLREKGVRSYSVHAVTLKLGESGDRWPLGQQTRRTPHLVAHDLDGREVAKVTVGSRSGCYLVSLPPVELMPQLVNADQPHAVVDLILAALPKDAK